ncbi:hypothetical protein E2I00_003453, partial [Balaenoptera physalus]
SPENEGSCGPSQEWVAPLVAGGPLCAWPLTVGRALPPFQLPILLKGTSDDDVPCPGYLFEEITTGHGSFTIVAGCERALKVTLLRLPEISHESLGSSQCLLEYLLSRLQSGSGRVLKIMLHLCGHGSSSFLLILKRNPAFIQEAAGLLLRALVSLPLLEGLWEDGTGEAVGRVFTGPPDPLHGNSLYQKVRAAAQVSPGPRSLPAFPAWDSGSTPAAGRERLCVALRGEGGRGAEQRGGREDSGRVADLGAALFSDALSPLPPSQPPRALPPAGMQGFGYSKERGHTGSAGEAFLSTIQKAAEVVASAMRPGPESPSSQRSLLRAMRHQPGQAGGGWDELDSSPNSQDSSQENDDLGKASDSGSPSGSDSPSGASRAPSDLAERVEAVTLSDCQQELSLVRAVTRGPHCFLSREEVQHFVKEALGAIASLGCTDLLSQERVLLLARPRLQELSILRHFEASCRQWPPARRPPAEPGPTVARVGPSDLLTDTLPLTGGQAFLQPLSSALFSPKDTAPPLGLQPSPVPPTSLDGCPLPAHADAREAKTRLAGSREQGAGSERGPLGTDTAKGGPELDPGPGDSCDSLFAGMELVACPRLVGARTAAEEPLPACQAPWTPSQRVAAKEPSGSEPSAFAFLNS